VPTMFTIRQGRLATGVCLLMLTACSHEQEDWRSAETADTTEAYAQFVREHPQSELAKQARGRMVQLEDVSDWQAAVDEDTPAAYREYLGTHPAGKWAEEARTRIESSRVRPAPEEEPVAATPASTSYGVQLGAFSSEAAAHSAWNGLVRRFPEELDGLTHRVMAAETPAGRLFRLQALVTDEAQARQLCDAMHQRSQACMTVRP
jgi:hypothetical protein